MTDVTITLIKISGTPIYDRVLSAADILEHAQTGGFA